MEEDYNDIAFTRNSLHYVSVKGKSLEERCAKHHHWVESRRNHHVWPFHRVILSPPSSEVRIGDEFGLHPTQCINFASQDYLSLAQDKRIHDAAKTAIDEYGVHSACSAILAGRTKYVVDIEEQLASVFERTACTLFSSGWAAGFGVISGLVREHDSIIIDALAHNCLQEGAKHVTSNVTKFRHNDVDHLHQLLKREREKNTSNGLFVVAESVYSMDSDSPNLVELIKVVRAYEGILILDVAHDFGSMGNRGLGLLESLSNAEGPDLIMGSFSKVFASNGGFVISSSNVKDYLWCHSAPFVFSNAMSPIQAKVVLECCKIVFSDEGNSRRTKLDSNIKLLRQLMGEQGHMVLGEPSPIVPVFGDNEKIARLAARLLENFGLAVNLVEFPAVPRGKARFRFQVMSDHQEQEIIAASRIMTKAILEAEHALAQK